MSKSILFTDFDNCIVNSTKKFCFLYNQIYKYNPDFVPAIWQNTDNWNFMDTCPLIENVEEIFKMKNFFTNLPFINDNTYEVLWELNKKYQIIIISIGSYKNIELKSKWVSEHLPFITESIFLVNNGSIMNKGCINMSGEGNVFIDDVVENLESIKDDNLRKIAFGTIHSWNTEWDGERALNWTEVGELLLQ